MVMRTADGPFPMNTEYGWTDAGPGRTEMALRNYGDPSGLFRLTGPAMELAMRRANRKDLERLKAGGGAVGASQPEAATRVSTAIAARRGLACMRDSPAKDGKVRLRRYLAPGRVTP